MAVGFGTDGGALNNPQGVHVAMRVARLCPLANTSDEDAITPLQGIRMATIDGARSIGLDHLVGSIEPGKRADLQIVDYEELPHSVPTHDIVVQLVHSMKTTDVRTTIVDGHVVMRDRRIETVDELAVLKAAAAAGKDLVRRLG
jgi:5-methylthioadenosine/S-adenosylhomocysteine deaminase